MDRRARRRCTAICSICNFLARPVVDHLSSLSTCNHVFHHSCLLQRCLHRPPNTKPRCPACTREFSSMRCIKRLHFQSPGTDDESSSSEEDVDECSENEKVHRLREKLSDKEAALQQQSHQVSVWKGRAERAEAEKQMLQKEKEYAERSLRMEVEELSRKALACPKLQQRVTEMEEEIALLKMTADLDLCEEEMVKIQSVLSDRMTQDDVVYVLKKSLALRSQQLKDIKFQSDLIAKEAKRTLKKYNKAQDKIAMLEARVDELEKKTTIAIPKIRRLSKTAMSLAFKH